MSKKHILKGTIILTSTGLLTKALGFVNRIYLSNLIGIKELGIYQMVFPIFILCFSLCTQGMSTTITKQVSAYLHTDKQKSNHIFYISTTICFLLGILIFIAVTWLSKPISIYILKNSRCITLIKIIAIAIPFVSLKGCINAFFLAHKKPLYCGISQFLEQLIRTTVVYILSISWSKKSINATLAVTSVVIGEICATLITIFIYLYYVNSKNKFISNREKESKTLLIKINKKARYNHQIGPTTKKYIKEIFVDFIPLTTSNILFTIFTCFESMIMPAMLFMFYKDKNYAIELYGMISGIVVPFLLFPGTITSSLSQIVLPTMSSAYNTKDNETMKQTYIGSVCACMSLGIIAYLAYTYLGEYICAITFKSSTSGILLKKMCITCPLIYLSTTLTTILNSINKVSQTLLFNILALSLRILTLIIFVPQYGINAYILGMAISYLLQCLLLIHGINQVLKCSEDT